MKLRTTTHGIPYEEGQPSADAFAVRVWGETVMAVLADGAGLGDPAREAAQRAVPALLDNYEARPRSWSPRRALCEFTELLNRTLYQESLARFDRPEMITTLAAVIIEGDRLFGVNVGDSKVCLARDGDVETLSQDHVETARTHVLTRALGMALEVEPHVFERELRNGDVVILCSDGISNHLTADHLAAELRNHGTARSIVNSARLLATRQTMDDMSAIVLEVAETGQLRAMHDRQLAIPHTLRKGDVMDGFELVRAFQETDRVWLAEKDGQRVVLKFAPREALDSEAHRNAFVREMWNATRLNSEHFVRASEPAEQTALYYLMEFVDAPSLARVLQDRKLSVDSAIGLGLFLAEAARILLRHDLAHGDIKPENILCVGDYAQLTFKLLDLGSAAEVFSITSRAGTASYLAPERFHGAACSERTEIYAIGVTLYQALTGAFPHGRIERFQTPVFHSPKRPTRLNPNLPPWLEAVILRAIATHPARRYQHYSELSYELSHPDRVEPYFEAGAPLLERNPLGFYKTAFFVLLAITIGLALQLLSRH